MKGCYHLTPGTMLADRYVIDVVLGKGGFGITYKAFDTKLNIIVAIKEFYPIGFVKRDESDAQIRYQSAGKEEEFQLGLHRFLEEARNLAKFSKHPNIVDVFHFFKENGTGYIVMEYLDGISMKYFLKVNEGKMSVLYAKEIALAIAGALETLHAAGIIHRDVSPDNIFLCSDGKIKLIDFGASRLSADDDSCREVIVKPGYAPPEQYQTDSDQGPWTDIYALGATCYCAVTGCVPLEATERVQEDLLVSPCEWHEEIPAYMDHIIRKAMALKPKDRFASAREMADALRQCKMVAVPKTKKEKQLQRRKYAKTGILAGMLGLILFGMVLCRRFATPRGTLNVWICAAEDTDVNQMEAYYNRMSGKWAAEEYPDMRVNVHVEKEDSYKEHLLQALETEQAPDVFESTGLADEVYAYSEELGDCAARMDRSDSYYFLSRYQTYFPKRRQMPIGFDVQVKYVLQGVNENEARNGASEAQDIYAYDGSDEQLQQFLTGQIPYLIGCVSDYRDVINAYETYVPEEKDLRGMVRVYPLENAVVTYRTLSVNADHTHLQKKMAELYIEYLLSYGGQQMMASQDERMLSVNCRVDGEDRKNIRKKLTILEQQLDGYR